MSDKTEYTLPPRVGVIIPDRGDRPRFFDHCLRQLDAQTLSPVEVAIMNYAPESGNKDITQRYRRGYDQLRNKNLDVIALIESDDNYSLDYLKIQLKAWQDAGRPHLFGTTYTIYYHLKYFAHFTMNHQQRSSAMSTLIKPDMDFQWPPDHEAFTDVWLFQHLSYKLWTPPKHICLGIKHGIGMTGGNSHMCDERRYANGRDTDKSFLRANTTEESFEFYSTYFD